MDNENTVARNFNYGTRTLPSLKEMKRKSSGETYCYLNCLIKGKSSQDFDNLNEVLSQEPLTLFEESLKLILIDSLHLENEVMKILLSQNDYQINRILKCNWFFENFLSADDFCNKVFPNIPDCFKWKIIAKLSKKLKREDEAAKMVEFLCSNYSCTLAELLLFRCNLEFVQKYLEKVPAPFLDKKSCRALLNVTKRFPEIGIQVLTFITESKLNYNIYFHGKTAKYLASQHSHLFIPFFEKKYSHFNYLPFGKKLSQKFGLNAKELLTTSPILAKSHIWKVNHLIRRLNFEDKVKVSSALVLFQKDKLSFDNWVQSEGLMTMAMETVKPSERLKFIETTFEQVYGSDFRKHPELWSSEILEKIPAKDRHFFVETLENSLKEALESDKQVNFNFDHELESLVYLYDCEIGFEKLKKIMLKATAISKRRIVLDRMVRNCSINKDIEGLEKLVDFVRTRHRNDDPHLLTNFVNYIADSFPMKKLTLSVLEKLEELNYYCALKGVKKGYGRLTERLILLKMEEKKDVEKHVKNFLDFHFMDFGWRWSFFFDYTSPHLKDLFFEYTREIMRKVKDDPQKVERVQDNLIRIVLTTCKEFNCQNKQNPIRVADIPGFDKILRDYLKKKFEQLHGEIWPLDIWDKFHGDLVNSFYNSKFLTYLLKHHPEIIIKNIDGFINYLLEHSSCEEFFKLAKKTFSFYEVTDRLKEMLSKEFKNGGPVGKKISALVFYSFLSNADEFGKLVADYIPQEEKIDGDQNSEFSQIQLAIPKLVKNLRPRCENFDLIVKFFFGDFLKNVMPSYYACCAYTRADEALAFLKEHFNKLPNRISMKKDVIRLIAGLSNRREKIGFCLKCWDENPHHSIRSILFAFIRKSFLDFPTEEQFEAVKKCVLESDEIVIEARPTLHGVPKTFLNEYVMVLWSFTVKLPAKTRNNFRSSILSSFDKDNINLLSESFCQDLIKRHLFEETSLDVTYFTICYLVSDPAGVDSKTNMILNLIENYVHKPNLISRFLNALLRKSLYDAESVSQILNVFLEKWPSSLNVPLYKDRLMLIFYNLLHSILKNGGSESLSNSLGKELRKFLSQHGTNDLIIVVIDSLKQFFRDLTTSNLDFDEIEAIKAFVAGSFERSFIIVGISVLSSDAVNLYRSDELRDGDRKKILKEFVEALKNYKDEVVDIYVIQKFGFQA